MGAVATGVAGTVVVVVVVSVIVTMLMIPTRVHGKKLPQDPFGRRNRENQQHKTGGHQRSPTFLKTFSNSFHFSLLTPFL